MGNARKREREKGRKNSCGGGGASGGVDFI